MGLGLLRIISVGSTAGPHPPARLCPGTYITPFPIHQLGLLVLLPGRFGRARGCPGSAGSEVLRALEMHSAGDSLPSELTWGSGYPAPQQEDRRALARPQERH